MAASVEEFAHLTTNVAEPALLASLSKLLKVCLFVKVVNEQIQMTYFCLLGINWVEKDANSGGRRLTSQGFKDLDRIAAQVREASKKVVAEEIIPEV